VPRKDTVHDAFKTALEKAGWVITHDPYTLKFREQKIYIDIGAELLAAERGERRIAVEIKSFVNPSHFSDFQDALGQYKTYELILEQMDPDRELFLAVPDEPFTDFFESHFGSFALEKLKLRLIAFDETKQEVLKWIEPNSTSNS
jgi:XisH protein